jgi:hypothetical protein
MTADLARLRELLTKATPGPWQYVISADALYIGAPRPDNPNRLDDVLTLGVGGLANATLITEAMNALPEILDALEPHGEDVVERVARAIDPELWEQIDRWRQAAVDYRRPDLSHALQDADCAPALARDCDRKADKNAEASFVRARAALSSLPPDQQAVRMREALEFYAEKARSLAEKDWKNKPDYALAILTELQLDGGKRAAAALNPTKDDR